MDEKFINYKYGKAMKLLEIKCGWNNISLNLLKKQYKKMALKYHPDKNGNTEESNKKFIDINESFHFLKRELNLDKNYLNESENYFKNEEKENEELHDNKYLNVLYDFIKSVMDKNNAEIIYNILMKGTQLSLKLFEELDKETLFKIYSFLSNYRSIIHCSSEFVSKVREILQNKYDNVIIYKLNPSLSDLFNNNFYKLYNNNKLYLVPLWHKESCFDGSGNEIIVICEPELPDGIEIDDDNNLYTTVELYAFTDLPELIIGNCDSEKEIIVNIGEKRLTIPISKLYLKQEQYFKFEKQGISKINNDIHDINDKSDIIVKILFV